MASSETDSDLSSDDLSEETASWIAWFCSIRGNEFFAMVDEEYITDSFNLSGLKEEVPSYDMAVETILDADQPNLQELSEAQQESVDSAAELLYGLIHARFILTAKGLTLMVRAVAREAASLLAATAHASPPILPSSLPHSLIHPTTRALNPCALRPL
jgi:casein kinase II subunit beta